MNFSAFVLQKRPLGRRQIQNLKRNQKPAQEGWNKMNITVTTQIFTIIEI